MASYPKQTSGVIRAAFAVYPLAGISAWLADSTATGASARGPSIVLAPDGTVKVGLGSDQEPSSLKVKTSRWHLIELQLDLNRHIAKITVNG